MHSISKLRIYSHNGVASVVNGVMTSTLVHTMVHCLEYWYTTCSTRTGPVWVSWSITRCLLVPLQGSAMNSFSVIVLRGIIATTVNRRWHWRFQEQASFFFIFVFIVIEFLIVVCKWDWGRSARRWGTFPQAGQIPPWEVFPINISESPRLDVGVALLQDTLRFPVKGVSVKGGAVWVGSWQVMWRRWSS